jgi:hypothetical protein
VSNLEGTTTTLSPTVRNQIPSDTALYPENEYLKISYVNNNKICNVRITWHWDAFVQPLLQREGNKYEIF